MLKEALLVVAKSILRRSVHYPALQRCWRALCYEWRKGGLARIRHYVSNGHVLRKVIVSNYLAQTASPMLQVGGGVYSLRGWLNGDIAMGDIYLDAGRRLPFPDNSFDFIFTEHFFEHITYESGLRFLREAYRILKPEGVIRQSTPSLLGTIEIYLDKNEHVDQRAAIRRHACKFRHGDAGVTPCRYFNDAIRLWGHKIIYDRETLMMTYKAAGFTELRWPSYGQSRCAALRDLERHSDSTWEESAALIICEAAKPREPSSGGAVLGETADR